MIEPIWLSVARMMIGIREVPGPLSNPTIIQWALDIGAPKWYDNDDKAWCAIAMNRLMLACQIPMATTTPSDGYDLLRAKTFEEWGIPLATPAYGSIMTFSRPEGNHVGLYLGERKDAYYIWGGNQGNAISYTWIKKARWTSTRWPKDIPVTNVGRIWLDITSGLVSTNEG
jgi:uncharacterized protein (TIGR02594 family)